MAREQLQTLTEPMYYILLALTTEYEMFPEEPLCKPSADCGVCNRVSRGRQGRSCPRLRHRSA